MNVLGVGPAELIVILVVALVFVGPERLPRLAADIARTIREIRKYTGSLAAEFNEVIQDFEKDTEGEKSAWKEIGEGLTSATKSVTDAVREARADAQGTRAGESAGPAAEASPADAAAGTEPRWVDISTAPPEFAPATAPETPNGASASVPTGALPAEEAR
jgi:sec-independent protein translocase protein TatB